MGKANQPQMYFTSSGANVKRHREGSSYKRRFVGFHGKAYSAVFAYWIFVFDLFTNPIIFRRSSGIYRLFTIGTLMNFLYFTVPLRGTLYKIARAIL
jgi:hypothetical protein